MASSSDKYMESLPQPTFPNGFDPNSIPNTTFVQADPKTFRSVVQKLTGAPTTGKLNSGEMGPRRQTFKLHERRPTAKKLEIKLNNNGGIFPNSSSFYSPNSYGTRTRSISGENYMVMSSPVSPFEYLAAVARGSPTTPKSPFEEEKERTIADKGFYLHPSPLSTPRGSDPPQLLPLFPLHSPRENNYHSTS